MHVGRKSPHGHDLTPIYRHYPCVLSLGMHQGSASQNYEVACPKTSFNQIESTLKPNQLWLGSVRPNDHYRNTTHDGRTEHNVNRNKETVKNATTQQQLQQQQQ